MIAYKSVTTLICWTDTHYRIKCTELVSLVFFVVQMLANLCYNESKIHIGETVVEKHWVPVWYRSRLRTRFGQSIANALFFYAYQSIADGKQYVCSNGKTEHCELLQTLNSSCISYILGDGFSPYHRFSYSYSRIVNFVLSHNLV